MWIIPVLILVIILLLILLIKILQRQSEMKKYYIAARRIIQEELLNDALQNAECAGNEFTSHRKMICLRPVPGKNKGYVFDPSRGVHIGRSSADNEICLQDKTVSGKHCILYTDGADLWLQDLDSANGTLLKHGFGKARCLMGEQRIVADGDKIYVGGTCFCLRIFYVTSGL